MQGVPATAGLRWRMPAGATEREVYLRTNGLTKTKRSASELDYFLVLRELIKLSFCWCVSFLICFSRFMACARESKSSREEIFWGLCLFVYLAPLPLSCSFLRVGVVLG